MPKTNKKKSNKHILAGAAKISLVFLALIVAIFVFSSFFVQKAEAGFAAVFAVNNISSGPIFAGSNAGVNTTSLESGATNVTLNISLRIANGYGANFRRNIVTVNMTLPQGFTFFPGDFSNETSNVSANNKTGNKFFNETFGASSLTNLTWRNQTGVAVALINGTSTFTGTPGQFAFRINVPAGIAKENAGNRSFNITVTTFQMNTDDSDGKTNTTNTANITIFINDTIAPAALRYISPTPENATTRTNTSVDFAIAFNETNPTFANLSIGFPNGTFENRSMTISGGGNSGTATLSIAGLPSSATDHNFTIFVTDIDNNQVQNSTFYKLKISSDSTAPTDFRFLSPTVANNTNTTNTTLDLMFNYTEINTDTTFLQIGFPNGSTVNRTNSTPLSENTATYAVKGLPDGKHNFTMFANDTNSNDGTNSSLYRIFIDTVSPAATLTLPSVSVQKGKSISSTDLTCTASDATSGFASSSFSINIEKPSAQTVTHTCGNEYTDTFDIGEYKATFSPQDRAGNTGSKTGTFDVKYAETGIGSSSSSSSTSSAAEDLAKTILSIGEALTAAKPVELTIPSEIAQGSASKIILEVLENVLAADATVQVKALEKIPESDSSGEQVEPLPDGQPVLKTMEFIVPKNLTSKLKQAKIEFSVTDAELSANNMAIDEVVMARFNSRTWNELPTIYIEAGNSTNKFSATTPGFSVFVVTKKSPQLEPEQSPQATKTPKGPRVSQYNKTSIQSQEIISLQTLVYVGIVLVMGLAVLFIAKKKNIGFLKNKKFSFI